MLGLIVGCVAVTLLADAALNPDTRRILRARLRQRRLARLREQQVKQSPEHAETRRMRTLARAQLPHLRTHLSTLQHSYRYSVAIGCMNVAAREAAEIDKTLAEITRLEPWLDG